MKAQAPPRAAPVEEHQHVFYPERQVERAPSPSRSEGREGPGATHQCQLTFYPRAGEWATVRKSSRQQLNVTFCVRGAPVTSHLARYR
jgi:hypothetical protein